MGYVAGDVVVKIVMPVIGPVTEGGKAAGRAANNEVSAEGVRGGVEEHGGAQTAARAESAHVHVHSGRHAGSAVVIPMKACCT